jgi:hypothetical protein
MAGGYWLLHNAGQARARSSIETDLLALVALPRVSPSLALLALADYPAEQVWQEPLRDGQWDGALAMWLAGSLRSDRETVGGLLALATPATSRNPNAAAACLRAAADVVRLSAELDDRERADWLVTIGKGLRDLGLPDAAMSEWRQALILAHHSPTLPLMYRATLLHDLALLYGEVGAGNMVVQPENAGVAGNPSVTPDNLQAPLAREMAALPAEPEPLLMARERRRAAAASAARALLQGPDAPIAYAELVNALHAERVLHEQWMTEQLQADPSSEVEVALWLYQINWLQRERMLAWGVGGEHFSEWTARRAQIELSLHEAWEALQAIKMEQSVSSGVQGEATLLQRAWWATRLVQTRLLRDPAAEEAAIVAAMRPNNADGAGGATLRLDSIQGRFWRIPREYVGTERLPE